VPLRRSYHGRSVRLARRAGACARTSQVPRLLPAGPAGSASITRCVSFCSTPRGLVAANAQEERRKLMWGNPGTMLAARAMHGLTGEERWLEVWRESAAWLRREWDPETELWTQHLYGTVEQFIGPAHGFAGCVLALAAEPDDDYTAARPRPCGATPSRRTGWPTGLLALAPTDSRAATEIFACSGATARPASSPRSPHWHRTTTNTSGCSLPAVS
jgi:hypothetical protein